MQFTFRATRQTPHGASRLVQVIPAWLGKPRRAPSRHSSDARVYGHMTTAMHKLSTPPPSAPLSSLDAVLCPHSHSPSNFTCSHIRGGVLHGINQQSVIDTPQSNHILVEKLCRVSATYIASRPGDLVVTLKYYYYLLALVLEFD